MQAYLSIVRALVLGVGGEQRPSAVRREALGIGVGGDLVRALDSLESASGGDPDDDATALSAALAAAVASLACEELLLSEDQADRRALRAAGALQRACFGWRDASTKIARARRASEAPGVGNAPAVHAPANAWRDAPSFWTDLGPDARPSLRVLSLACPVCGGQRAVRSRSAYVYCLYCGELAGVDFTAMERRGATPAGPAYEALSARLAPELGRAVEAQDRAAFTALQRRLFLLHAELCPDAYSPRIRDAGYRDRIVEYQAELAAERTFSDELRARFEAIPDVAWVDDASGGRRPRSDDFRRSYEAHDAYWALSRDVREARGIDLMHPDAPCREVDLRLSRSTFVQAWLPHLSPSDAAWLLERSGLAVEYVEVRLPLLGHVRCATCEEDLPAPLGSRQVVCEGCGALNRIGDLTFDCAGCGAPVVLGAVEERVRCRHCNVEAVAWRPGA